MPICDHISADKARTVSMKFSENVHVFQYTFMRDSDSV